MEKGELHPSDVETSQKRPWESSRSSRGCCSPCGCPAAGGLASRDPRGRGGGRQHTLFPGRV